MIIQQRHFPVCPFVSREHLTIYAKLKGLTARSASTKEYWIAAAKKLVRNMYCPFYMRGSYLAKGTGICFAFL
jgi:hypothetical protein